MINSNHTRIGQTIATGVVLNLGNDQQATVNLHLNEEHFILIEGLNMDPFEFQLLTINKNKIAIQIMKPLSDNVPDLVEDELSLDQLLAKDIELNLGGGANSFVNFHLTKNGILIIENLGTEHFEYGWDVHDKNLAELQILYSFDEEEDEWD